MDNPRDCYAVPPAVQTYEKAYYHIAFIMNLYGRGIPDGKKAVACGDVLLLPAFYKFMYHVKVVRRKGRKPYPVLVEVGRLALFPYNLPFHIDIA